MSEYVHVLLEDCHSPHCLLNKWLLFQRLRKLTERASKLKFLIKLQTNVSSLGYLGITAIYQVGQNHHSHMQIREFQCACSHLCGISNVETDPLYLDTCCSRILYASTIGVHSFK